MALLLVLLAVLAPSSGCGDGGGALAAPPPSPPHAFADESFAELATDGARDLWMAIAGFDQRKHFGLRVLQKQNSIWKPLPSPPGKVSGDRSISIAVAKTNVSEPESPCIGYSETGSGRPIVTCWSSGVWTRHPVPGLPKAWLLQIASDSTDSLIALFLDRPRPGANSTYRVLRLDSNGWAQEGPGVTAPSAVAQLGTDIASDPEQPTIGVVTQLPRSTRYVLHLEGDHWQKLGPAIHNSGMGPMIGGPVILERQFLFPVNDALETPWSFSAQAVRIGSRRVSPDAEQLSVGAGNAQGRLNSVDGAVWATWQEHRLLPDGRFRTGIFAARLNSDGGVDSKVELWRGVSIGPGSTQVIEFRGRRLALYMPSSPDGKGLRATVRELR